MPQSIATTSGSFGSMRLRPTTCVLLRRFASGYMKMDGKFLATLVQSHFETDSP